MTQHHGYAEGVRARMHTFCLVLPCCSSETAGGSVGLVGVPVDTAGEGPGLAGLGAVSPAARPPSWVLSPASAVPASASAGSLPSSAAALSCVTIKDRSERT